MSDDGEIEIGELVETDYFRATDSDIQPGDHIYFKLKHDAFRFAPEWPELVGEVLAVLAGYEIVYLVKVVTRGVLRWPDRFVRRCDITRVWVPEW